MPRIFRLPESKSEEVGGNGQPWLKGFHQSLRLPSVMHDAGLATSTTLFIGTRQDISSESGRDRGLSRRAVSGQATFLTPSRLHHGSFQTSPEIPRVPANASHRKGETALECSKPQALKGKRLRIILGVLILASLQSAISELQAPAWSCLAEPSLWPDTKRERVSFCCRVLPCDVVSVLPGQRPLSKTLHTHRGWTESFQSGHA